MAQPKDIVFETHSACKAAAHLTDEQIHELTTAAVDRMSLEHGKDETQRVREEIKR